MAAVCLLNTSRQGACLLQVCDDTVEEDDGEGAQTLFRVVRIPFRVLFVTGNLKMRLHVEQDSKTGHVSAVLTCKQLLLPRPALLLHQPIAELIVGATPCCRSTSGLSKRGAS